MSINNAHMRLGQAVDMLATPHKGLVDQLTRAWTEGLSRVEAEDLPFGV